MRYNYRMDIAEIRDQFPTLRNRIKRDGIEKEFVYLDSAATALKPHPVIDAINAYYSHSGVSVHRGMYELSQHATETYEAVRQKVADYFGANDAYDVIFTKGTTESLNLVAYSWAEAHLTAADEIVSTEIEHHANLIPWQRVAAKTKSHLRHIRLNPASATLYADEMRNWRTGKTKLLAISGMSNVTGWKPQLVRMLAEAQTHAIVTVIDGAQLGAHAPVQVAQLGCDFFCCSAHKLGGPSGVGVLIGRKALLARMEPFLRGGSIITDVFLDHALFRASPERFEAGTPHIAGVLGFGALLDWLATIDSDWVQQHERSLLAHCCAQLNTIPEVRYVGNPLDEHSSAIVSFNVAGIHAHDVGSILDQEGVAVRVGHHCAQPLHRALDVASSVRASFHMYNRLSDVDALCTGIRRALKIFGRKRV